MQILARAVGRRKEAVAQVQIVKGSGQFTINSKPAQQYLQNNSCSLISVKSPFLLCQLLETNGTAPVATPSMASSKNLSTATPLTTKDALAPLESNLQFSFDQVDTIVKVKGGGLIGQADAIKLAVARAICSITDLKVLQNTNVLSPLTSSSLSPEGIGANVLSPKNNIGVEGISTPSSPLGDVPSKAGEEQSLDGLDNLNAKEHANQPQDKANDLGEPVLLDSVQTEHNSYGEAIYGEAGDVSSISPLGKEETNNLENIFKKQLKTKGYLTQDSRVKERRKYGLKKARKASQYHKR